MIGECLKFNISKKGKLHVGAHCVIVQIPNIRNAKLSRFSDSSNRFIRLVYYYYFTGVIFQSKKTKHVSSQLRNGVSICWRCRFSCLAKEKVSSLHDSSRPSKQEVCLVQGSPRKFPIQTRRSFRNFDLHIIGRIKFGHWKLGSTWVQFHQWSLPVLWKRGRRNNWNWLIIYIYSYYAIRALFTKIRKLKKKWWFISSI